MVDFKTGAMASLLPKLDELRKEYDLPTGIKPDVELLQRELTSMYDAVHNGSEVSRGHIGHSKEVVAGCRELSYCIDDWVDAFMANPDTPPYFISSDYEILIMDRLLGHEDDGDDHGASASGTSSYSYRLVQSIRNFKQEAVKLKQLLGHANGSVNVVVDGGIDSSSDTISPTTMLHASRRYKRTDLVGINAATDEVINKGLTDGTQQLKIVSIVGDGGVGKTALASIVYHELISKYDCGAFVSFSLVNMDDIFKTMLCQLDVESYMNFSKDQAKAGVRKFLQNKRYLIVIDDIENPEDCHNILGSLPNNYHGSRVITTTRVNNIAKICCSGHDESIYEVNHLGYEDSKRLFLKNYLGSEESCPDTPTKVVDEILEVGGGVPSEIIRIASLLASKVTAKEPCKDMMNSLYSAWKDIPESTIIDSKKLRKFLSEISCSLKTCLLYLATSAGNQRKNLVRKWISEGFISENEERSCEEVAEGYFDDLINRNLILPVERGNNCLGKETYEVNWMILKDLRQISQEENFVTLVSDFDTVESDFFGMAILQRKKQSRHVRLAIQCSGTSNLTKGMDLSHVRSIAILGPAKLLNFKNFGYVRVLDLDGCEDLDSTDVVDICRMILLKYLSLRQTQVTEIPPQIGNLQNLEILHFSQMQVQDLPTEVFKLQKLAHLSFGQSSPIEGVTLEHLKTLQDVTQTREERIQLNSAKLLRAVDARECSGSTMEEIISGHTEVEELEVILYDGPADKKRNDTLLLSISKCRKLQSLTIYGDCNPSDDLPAFPNLENLNVSGRFLKVPQWIAQLSALKKLEIRVCKLEPNDMMIFGQLSCLSSLAIALVASLPRKEALVITSSAGFPRLEVFRFDCRVPWVTFEHGAMPGLKHLDLKLYACLADNFPTGITLLESLNVVILRYSSNYAESVSVTKTVAVMKKEAASHANLILLWINGNREILPSNTSLDTRITSTEIEE